MRRAGQYQQVLLKVPMFQACTKRELAMVSRLAEDCRFKPGEILVKEGDRGQEFFVVVEGKAEVSRGGKKVAVLGPGPRDATVTALTPMEAVVLGRREFTGLLAEVPPITTRLLVGMARRLREADTHVVR